MCRALLLVCTAAMLAGCGDEDSPHTVYFDDSALPATHAAISPEAASYWNAREQRTAVVVDRAACIHVLFWPLPEGKEGRYVVTGDGCDVILLAEHLQEGEQAVLAGIVLAHELGHALGYAHVCNPGAVMHSPEAC